MAGSVGAQATTASFLLTGAAISHAVAGDGAQAILTPLGVLALAIASWALRPASRRLGTLALAEETRALHSVRSAA